MTHVHFQAFESFTGRQLPSIVIGVFSLSTYFKGTDSILLEFFFSKNDVILNGTDFVVKVHKFSMAEPLG